MTHQFLCNTLTDANTVCPHASANTLIDPTLTNVVLYLKKLIWLSFAISRCCVTS